MKIITFAFSLLSLSVFAQNEGDYHLDKEFNLSPTGTIELSSSDAKVYITGSNRSTAHLKVDRSVVTKGIFIGHDEFALEIDDTNGNLRIRERSSSSNVGIVGYYHEDYTINIEAPEGASLVVRGDDGDYLIRNINGSISLSVDDADVDLFGCKGNRFQFKLDDGDLKMDQGRGVVEIDTDDGDVEIKNGQFRTIIADIDDGDLIIETSLADDGDYNIRAQDGLVAIAVSGGGGEFSIRHDDARVIADSGFEMREKSDSYTSVKLPNGGARVDIRADDARVRLSRSN